MLKYLLSALNNAVIAFDITEHRLLCFSKTLPNVTGHGKKEFEHDLNLLTTIIHPDDRTKIAGQVQYLGFPINL